MKVTIKDIAAETGLSLATISKYLNNRKVQDSNRILIENAIKKLNYKPNSAAQRLRFGATMTIAVIISDIGNYFWGNLISTLIQHFRPHNYTVITCSYYHNHQTEEVLIRDLIAKGIDGIILLPFNSSDHLYTLIQEAEIPVVVVDQVPEQMQEYPVDCVVSANYKGSYLLAKHLIEYGHKNIGVLDTMLHSYSIKERVRGIQEACQEVGITPYIPKTTMPFTNNQDVMKLAGTHFQELERAAPAITAVIFTNYASAMGGLTEIGSSGRNIPGDCSIVSFDDDPLFRSMYPPITAVAQDFDKLGQAASALLLRRIQGDFSDFPRVFMADVDFRKRESVKIAAT